jgi:predicted O-methyltransferase YrrM
MQLSEHFNLASGFSRLKRASAADVKRWITTMPAVISAPKTLKTVNGLCTVFPRVSRSEAEALEAEFFSDPLHDQLEAAMQEKRNCKLTWQEWHPFLYGAVRILKPRRVMETGVFDGRSSVVILSAMERNQLGELVSIDLPAKEEIPGATDRMCQGLQTTLPKNCDPGWLVPEYLRERQRLHLGDSRKLLPDLLNQPLDIFLHDSLHTYSHQIFEYVSAWPHIIKGGLLLSDDIFWSAAFHRFARSKRVSYANLGDFGAIVKPHD